MLVAGHQAEFLPWLGFWNKVACCDVFIIVDNVQFKRHHFENRNKVRVRSTPHWQYITVPVRRAGREQLIKNVRLADDGGRWKRKLLKTIEASYSTFPYFQPLFGMLSTVIIEESEFLAVLNRRLIAVIMHYLGIQRRVIVQSATGVEAHGTDLINALTSLGGGAAYLSGPSGRNYLDRERLKVPVQFTNFHHPVYEHPYGSFLPGMSVIDVLFSIGPSKTMELIQRDIPTEF